ncbi:MAG: sigma-54-dependent Fis family transcriptional regulator [Bdellovibrionales bacterium]|nr:sigma-54-dependent Fis family transcriptional regulator [Bdellovibrionales bacterium]
MFKVLVVDDDNALRLTVSSAFSERNYAVDQARDGEEAVNKVMAGKYDLVLLDVNMPRMNGIEALRQIKAFDSRIIVIILTAYSNVKDAVEAVRLGAYNYLEKPIKGEDLVSLVDRALKAHNTVKAAGLSAPTLANAPAQQNGQGSDNKSMVGTSQEMKRIFHLIEKVALVDSAVLIRGESGTGKELVARAVHMNSPRKDERFVAINCSAIPEGLIESEFFGHEKGAFTGADSRKIGKFQFADGGTLFLDEIGDITPAMQVKLLRVLQEKRFTPVGSNREVESSVRIIAATNKNLEEAVKQGSFREDLFYRLNVLPIQLPPLRQRKDDIAPLIRHFLERFNAQYGHKIRGLTPEAEALMLDYSWPGNIRELEHVVEHAFVVESGAEISPQSLPEKIRGLTAAAPRTPPTEGATETEAFTFSISSSCLDFQAQKEEFEKHFIISALKVFNGRINQTAIHANIPKKTLLRKLEKYGLDAREFKDE